MGQAFLYGSARPTPQITIQRHLRSQSYGPRRRRVHTEEGNAERRPLITSHSPIRAYTEPQRPTSVRAPSTSSITSTGPTTPWITESPKQANARI
jgi:hypothetical protein